MAFAAIRHVIAHRACRRSLVVGDGDLSYSSTLVSKLTGEDERFPQLTVSVLEDASKFHQKYADSRERIIRIQEKGVTVLFSVDATDIAHSVGDSHGDLFDCIIFNFPHVGGKSNIKKNRELLKNFFISAKSVLCPSGCILVTLCKGQSGTNLDTVRREWYNSWKVTAMAAEGGFILSRVWPFSLPHDADYSPTGYRSQRKGFHSEEAQTYMFVRSDSASHSTPASLPTLDEPIVTTTTSSVIGLSKETLWAQLTTKDHPVHMVYRLVIASLRKASAKLPQFHIIDLLPPADSSTHPCVNRFGAAASVNPLQDNGTQQYECIRPSPSVHNAYECDHSLPYTKQPTEQPQCIDSQPTLIQKLYISQNSCISMLHELGGASSSPACVLWRAESSCGIGPYIILSISGHGAEAHQSLTCVLANAPFHCSVQEAVSSEAVDLHVCPTASTTAYDVIHTDSSRQVGHMIVSHPNTAGERSTSSDVFDDAINYVNDDVIVEVKLDLVMLTSVHFSIPVSILQSGDSRLLSCMRRSHTLIMDPITQRRMLRRNGCTTQNDLRTLTEAHCDTCDKKSGVSTDELDDSKLERVNAIIDKLESFKLETPCAGFEDSASPELAVYTPWSLSPPRYVHDVSFWLPSSGRAATHANFLSYVLKVAPGLVLEVEILERFYLDESYKGVAAHTSSVPGSTNKHSEVISHVYAAESSCTSAKDNNRTSAKDNNRTCTEDSSRTPVEDNGHTPAEDNGRTPAEDNGLTPAEDNGLTPAEDNGLTPAGDNGLTPAEDNGYTPEEDSSSMSVGVTLFKGNDSVTPNVSHCYRIAFGSLSQSCTNRDALDAYRNVRLGVEEALGVMLR